MNPTLITLLLTFSLAVLTAALFGPTGTYYLVTTAGLPHFILGFVFAAISIRHGRPRRRVLLAWLTAISVLACLVYSRYPIFDLVGAYFVVHMFRDEVFMFFSRSTHFDPAAWPAAGSGEGPRLANNEPGRIWMAGRIFLLVGLAAYVLGRMTIFARTPRQSGLYTDSFVHLTGAVPLDLAIGAGVLLLLILISYFPRDGRLASFLPMEMRDFLSLFVAVAFVAHLREATLFLAMFHYVSWYLFYGEKLRARRRQGKPPNVQAGERAGFWHRAMTDPAAFTATMLAANLLAVAGLVLYLWQPDTLWPLQAGYEYQYFPYWTIPHVTLSLVPRR